MSDGGTILMLELGCTSPNLWKSYLEIASTTMLSADATYDSPCYILQIYNTVPL